MAGRSGLQSFLLSHTKPVTTQASHFSKEQTHMLGIVDVPPGGWNNRVRVFGMEAKHLKNGGILPPALCSCLWIHMPLTFLRVLLAVTKQCQDTGAGSKEFCFLASDCDIDQISPDLLFFLIAFRLYTLQLYLIIWSLFVSRETLKCLYHLCFPLPGVVLTGRFVYVEM